MVSVSTHRIASAVHVIFWQDIFVVIDNGKARAADYANVANMVQQQSAKYPGGMGCLTIIPEHATPPNDEVRRALNSTLKQLEDRLRCLCWSLEGAGFQAAMVRGALTGIRMFARHRYPTHIATSTRDAVAWILPHLAGGNERVSQAPTIASFIQRERDAILRGR
jgi:hypothetical protein